MPRPGSTSAEGWWGLQLLPALLLHSGGHYFRVDSVRDGLHAWLLNHTWSGLEGEVDAAFSWADKLYFIQVSYRGRLDFGILQKIRGSAPSQGAPFGVDKQAEGHHQSHRTNRNVEQQAEHPGDVSFRGQLGWGWGGI